MSNPVANGPRRISDPGEALQPLIRVRQVREYTDEPPTRAEIDAIVDVARWSGSSRNTQPWRFIVVRSVATIRMIAEIGLPQTRSLRTATAAVAIILPHGARDISLAYDEGRVAERILIAASLLGIGAGIAWIRSDINEEVGRMLGLPADRFVRTVMALGHPSEAGLAPKSPPGQARLPRSEVVFEERWPGE
jgi:nitroreductase